VTVKVTPLLACPFTVTTTGPVAAPAGTGAAMLPALQLVGVVAMPLKVTVLVPWFAPNVLPAIVTDVPTPPDVGDKLLIFGVTVKLTPLLICPFTVTTTEPVVAPAGTAATILVALHELGVAVTPLNFTVLLPWVAPKVVPVIVTDAPTGPDVGETLVIAGGGSGKGATICES